MTKNELFNQFKDLQQSTKCYIEGIYYNSTKAQIQNAIQCLKCTDTELDSYITKFSSIYPNMHNTIVNNGNWKLHSHNRLYVYNTVRLYA